MANSHNIKVGDTLFYVPSDRREYRKEVTVTKVGRNYFYCGDMKGDLENLHLVREYGSGGRFYLSKEDYEREVSKNAKMRKVLDLVAYNRDKVSFEDAESVYSILEKYFK